MIEQTYMKLQDKVTRPKLTKEKVNRENKHFKRVVDQYINWCKQGGGYEETRETYEDDIIKCLFEFDHDGYYLATFLNENVYIEPDSELVDILDDVQFVVRSLTEEIIGQWTKENFLEIPSNVIGKKVNAKQGYKKYENHYITGIKPETYEVTVSDDINKKGGWIIRYENITFL
jgi:hypothetical protein